MMDNSLIYKNGAGDRVEFRIDGSWHYNNTDLHDYEWSYNEVSGRVASFTREPRDFKLHAVMAGGSLEERNRALDVFEHDVYAGKPGTLICGECRMRCWVIASAKDLWWYADGSMDADLTIHADDPVWTRERTLQFFRDESAGAGGFLDYPHGYPYDYRADERASLLHAPFPRPCRFRLVFYGPAESPYVIIGGNRYQVNASLSEGDLLTVDSLEGTIVLRSATGTESSLFASGVREEGASIFADMPAGSVPVSWSGAFGFDVTYIEERSEPVWS